MTGMNVRRLMILMTKNPRIGINLSIFPTQMPRNPTIGMMRWMANGNHHRLTIQTTRYEDIMNFSES